MNPLDGLAPVGYHDAPDERHCPVCSACCRPVGHCCDDDCAPNWQQTGDPSPDERCACDCERCLKPWASTCNNAAEHRICTHHRRNQED